MARRRGFWAELQRERARAQRAQEQAYRARLQAEARARREEEQARRAAERQAAASERERKRLYVEDRKAEAEAMTAEVRARVAELEGVLRAGLRQPSVVTFTSLRRRLEVPPFDPAGLDKPLREPTWVAPSPPGLLGRLFGGTVRYEQDLAAARQDHERRRAQHAADEADRRGRLEQRHRDYENSVTEAREAEEQHNAEVEQFAVAFGAGEPEAVAQLVTLVLDNSNYPDGFPHRFRVLYRPEPKEVVIEYDLPPQDVVPTVREYRYVQKHDAIQPSARPVAEVAGLYRSLVAQVALRTVNEVFDIADEGVIDAVTFNGHVSTKDKGTGQPVHPCLIGVTVSRDRFANLVLSDLDPVVCVRNRLGALMSPHPYDLEAVAPVVDFTALLTRYKFVEGMDAVAALDSRPDLLNLTPTEFEHLVRQLFEAMSMKAWNTEACKDDGVDAVVVSEDPVFGGLCVVQAKRYSSAVGVDAVRELAGVMEDKHATKGFLVTTSWVTKDGHQLARRHGRMQFIECHELRYMVKEYLERDVLIGLPRQPPRPPNLPAP